MKIVELTSEFSMGNGISNVIKTVSEELNKDFEVEIWYSFFLREKLETEVKSIKVERKDVFKKLLTIKEKTIVHTHFGKNFVLTTLAKFFNKNIIHIHTDYVNPHYKITKDFPLNYYKVKWGDFFGYFFGLGVDRAFGISNYSCKEIRKNFVPWKKIKKISLGIESPAKKSNKKYGKNIKFGCLARFSRSKNLKFLIESFPYFPKDSSLKVVGAIDLRDKEYYEECNNLAKKNGVKIQINLSNKEFEEFYNSIDVLLYPSNWEGFGLPLVEAMARGNPCMCLNKFAMPELVKNNINGFVAKNEEDFIKKINLFMDKSILKRLSNGAYNFSKNYTKEKMGKNYVKEIKLIAKKYESKK